MRCVETRRHELASITIKWRRYRDEVGGITTTCEIPTELWNELAAMCGKPGLVVTRVVRNKNVAKQVAKRDKAIELLNAGWKQIAVAHELGISDSTVTRYNKLRK